MNFMLLPTEPKTRTRYAGEDDELAHRDPMYDALVRRNDKPNSEYSLWIESEFGRYIFDCDRGQLERLAHRCTELLKPH